MLVGSVSNKLIHVARVPVMVAHWADVNDKAETGAVGSRRSAELENDRLTGDILEHGPPMTF